MCHIVCSFFHQYNTIYGIHIFILFYVSKNRLPTLFFSSFFLHFFHQKLLHSGAKIGPLFLTEVFTFFECFDHPTTIEVFGFLQNYGNLSCKWYCIDELMNIQIIIIRYIAHFLDFQKYGHFGQKMKNPSKYEVFEPRGFFPKKCHFISKILINIS